MDGSVTSGRTPPGEGIRGIGEIPSEGGVPRESGAGWGDHRGTIEAIVTEHETALLRYAGRILHSDAAAQDVVQNVFVKLVQSWRAGARPSRHLRAWLYRVTHNEAIDLVRRESRLRVLHERHTAEQESACPDGISCGETEGEKRELVLGFLRRLHPREQQVVLLRLEEGLSYEEIGAVTGRTVGNVGNILHHAVRKLAWAIKARSANRG